MEYKVPGVYVEEISGFPPSVVGVDTAIPAFIGYTANHGTLAGTSSDPVIRKIESLVEYQAIFGGPKSAGVLTITTSTTTGVETLTGVSAEAMVFRMYYTLQLYFANGGGPCYIVSVGAYDAGSPPAPIVSDFNDGIEALDVYDEPTLYVITDALPSADHYGVAAKAIQHCTKLGDRFLIMDVDKADLDAAYASGSTTPLALRGSAFGVNQEELSYGAAYAPYLKTTLSYEIDEHADQLVNGSPESLNDQNGNSQLYNDIKAAVAALEIVLPPSGAVAGAYCYTDRVRGVWKAPAGSPVRAVSGADRVFTESQLAGLNVDATSGRSVNVIRNFTGQGTLIWGTRTLDGNSNDWRYVPVRRLFLMVEESVKKATRRFVFEPNDGTTWERTKTMISNFLSNLFRDGALQGNNAEEAYYVNVGLGSTMTADDILNGRMIIEIGMAPVRPAEFIILRFTQFLSSTN